MNISQQFPAIFAGTAIASALVILQPQAAQALTGEEISDISREVTVLIKGEEGGHGSGVIVSQNGNSYYILTANHVVSQQQKYNIVTADKQAYVVEYSKVTSLPGADLAVIEFGSDKDYQVAKLANSDQVKEGKPVFVSGWPRLTTVGKASGTQLVRQFTNGQVSGFLDAPLNGYEMIYTNTTLGGMSGGPVLDAGGRVVGIHGLGDTEDSERLQREGLSEESASSIAGLIKPGFNYAIPINTFLSLAPQQGLYLSLQVDNSAAPPLGAPYVASGEPDPRDTISDINETLNTVNGAVNTLRNICGLFGC